MLTEHTRTERSEVCTHNRGQHSPIQTDLARLIRCLLYGKQECSWFVLADILLANGDERNLNLLTFSRPLYSFFSSGFLTLSLLFLEENCQYFCFLVFNFQPIKFVNSVVPSPCETAIYIKKLYNYKFLSTNSCFYQVV